MQDQLVHKDHEYIKILPGWAQELANKYRSKTTNLYIVHGNIRDFLPHEKNEDEFIFRRVQEYISEVLFG
ncbi:MAG: AAA family ATPase, partial [Treponema sp.]|nr:AAA family ATPase [Treponema sp.]